MNIKIPLNISIVVFSYLLVLIIVAPVIDHFFDELQTDIQEKDKNSKILLEIILHIIVLSITWYIIHKYMSLFLYEYLRIRITKNIQASLSIITSVALVGLQTNLISKLKYITKEHPFRFLNI